MTQDGSAPQPRRARAVDAGHRATSFELLFDLVFVFAVAQIGGYLAITHTGYGVLRGLLLLALVWQIWQEFAWLGNRAYGGVLRAGAAIALAAVFVIALAIPKAWHDVPSGLDGPIAFVVAYIVVRCIHLTLSTMAAANDTAFRRKVRLIWVPVMAALVLLLTGAVVGGVKQTVLYAVTVLISWGWAYLSARRGGWQIYSAGHFSERHQLFIIIALGESFLAIGFSATPKPISIPLIVAAVLGITVALSLWRLYFDVATGAAEDRLRDVVGQARVRMAMEAYSYGHFPIVTGIIFTTVGVEGILVHAGDVKPLGAFDSLALLGGTALYLTGDVIFKTRMQYPLSRPRLITALLVLAATPAAAVLPPLAELGGLVLVLAVLIVIEAIRFPTFFQRE